MANLTPGSTPAFVGMPLAAPSALIPASASPMSMRQVANGADGALNAESAPRSIEKVMDELMLQYLMARGYKIEAPTGDGDVEMASAPPLANGLGPHGATPMMNGSKQHRVVSEDERRRFLGTDRINHSAGASLEKYARQLGLTTESCAANHILFYGLTGGDPAKYIDAYARLSDWVCNSLDMYKYELHAIMFPVFVHCYLDLIAKGYVEAAKEFFLRFARDHMRLHVEELRQLSLIFTPEQVRANEYAQQVLHSKFNVHVSLLSFELLNAFLNQEQLFLMLTMVNERINIVVTSNQPGMLIEQLEDVTSIEGTPNMSVRSEAINHQTADELAQVIASSESPNESEIGVQVTSGEYNLEYMVQLAGGEGSTLEDLHAIKVNWGVLPTRKLHQDHDSEGNGAGGSSGKGDDDAGGASASGGGSADTIGGGASGDGDKKNGSSNGLNESGPVDGATGSKSGDKAGSKTGASGDKASEAQRKAKRSRLGTETDLDRRKSELDVMGPLPDRKNAFNAHILERLVLRQPAEMKAQALEDILVRASLNKSNLPSALCFTSVNSGGAHVNNMCFSEDVTMVGASCDDGSFRVWRNDDQPLGTARGAIYHGDVTEIDDEEKTAVLRGHSSAVYGADFSPDNRFALTGSGDSTVRLWSLAAKSNVVIYRSHEGYPVWDVRFGRYGYYFASCSMDRTARLWSTDRMTPLRVFAGHLSDVDCVEFHPNHNYIATGSSDKTVRLWDIQTGKCVRIFTGHFHGVKSLAFSNNGRYLASSGEDQYINVWDLQAGKRLETLVGHRATVTSLSFSQESTILASSGMDSTVRLWDVQSIVDKPAQSVVVQPNNVPFTASSTPLQASAASSKYVRPVHMVRPSAVHELPPSRFLLKTLRSKQTPIYRVQFTPRNLLLSGGVFQPKVDG